MKAAGMKFRLHPSLPPTGRLLRRVSVERRPLLVYCAANFQSFPLFSLIMLLVFVIT